MQAEKERKIPMKELTFFLGTAWVVQTSDSLSCEPCISSASQWRSLLFIFVHPSVAREKESSVLQLSEDIFLLINHKTEVKT